MCRLTLRVSAMPWLLAPSEAAKTIRHRKVIRFSAVRERASTSSWARFSAVKTTTC